MPEFPQRYWDFSYTNIFARVETIRTSRASGRGPPEAAMHMAAVRIIGADFSFFFLGLRTNSLPSVPSPPFPPSPPFRSRSPKYSEGVYGSAESSPIWGLRQRPSGQTIWCILESKSAGLVSAVFVDFPKNKCNFLHKNKVDIVWRVLFLTRRRPMRSFSPGAARSIAPWKSAHFV